jgi:arabinose-5-phosphate isomerase
MNLQTVAPDYQKLEAARLAMATEAGAISAAAQRLDVEMALAMEVIEAHRGAVVVAGMGMSEQLGRKLTATLCATGTPAIFLDPHKACQGEMGGYSPGDPVLMLSERETPSDLLRLVALLHNAGSPVIGIVGSGACPLAAEADFILAADVSLAPGSHRLGALIPSVVLTALGDALAYALMCSRTVSSDPVH